MQYRGFGNHEWSDTCRTTLGKVKRGICVRFHPDRRHKGSEAQRRTSEEALAVLNAAFERVAARLSGLQEDGTRLSTGLKDEDKMPLPYEYWPIAFEDAGVHDSPAMGFGEEENVGGLPGLAMPPMQGDVAEMILEEWGVTTSHLTCTGPRAFGPRMIEKLVNVIRRAAEITFFPEGSQLPKWDAGEWEDFAEVVRVTLGRIRRVRPVRLSREGVDDELVELALDAHLDLEYKRRWPYGGPYEQQQEGVASEEAGPLATASWDRPLVSEDPNHPDNEWEGSDPQYLQLTGPQGQQYRGLAACGSCGKRYPPPYPCRGICPVCKVRCSLFLDAPPPPPPPVPAAPAAAAPEQQPGVAAEAAGRVATGEQGSEGTGTGVFRTVSTSRRWGVASQGAGGRPSEPPDLVLGASGSATVPWVGG